jgi:hypothetical protein
VIEELIRYLREAAQTCTSLVRICLHLTTTHGCEEIAHDLMGEHSARMTSDVRSRSGGNELVMAAVAAWLN